MKYAGFYSLQAPAEFGDYTQSLRNFGHDPAQFPRAVIREFYVADDSQRAWEEVRPHFLHVYQKVYCLPWGRFSR